MVTGQTHEGSGWRSTYNIDIIKPSTFTGEVGDGVIFYLNTDGVVDLRPAVKGEIPSGFIDIKSETMGGYYVHASDVTQLSLSNLTGKPASEFPDHNSPCYYSPELAGLSLLSAHGGILAGVAGEGRYTVPVATTGIEVGRVLVIGPQFGAVSTPLTLPAYPSQNDEVYIVNRSDNTNDVPVSVNGTVETLKPGDYRFLRYVNAAWGNVSADITRISVSVSAHILRDNHGWPVAYGGGPLVATMDVSAKQKGAAWVLDTGAPSTARVDSLDTGWLQLPYDVGYPGVALEMMLDGVVKERCIAWKGVNAEIQLPNDSPDEANRVLTFGYTRTSQGYTWLQVKETLDEDYLTLTGAKTAVVRARMLEPRTAYYF